MPGGPVVDQAALMYPGDIYDFPRPLLNKNGNNFSFSGLKTAMLRFREKNLENTMDNHTLYNNFYPYQFPDIYQHALFKVLCRVR